MKKLTSLTLAVLLLAVLAPSVIPSSWAAGETMVSTFAELVAALESGKETIYITADIEFPEVIAFPMFLDFWSNAYKEGDFTEIHFTGNSLALIGVAKADGSNPVLRSGKSTVDRLLSVSFGSEERKLKSPGSITLENLTWDGGGVMIDNRVNLAVRNCVFQNIGVDADDDDPPGALLVSHNGAETDRSHASIENCLFRNNGGWNLLASAELLTVRNTRFIGQQGFVCRLTR